MAESSIPQNDTPIELLRSYSPSRDFFAAFQAALGLGARPKARVIHTHETDKLTEATRGRLPARGLLYSFLAHEAAIILLLLVPTKFQPERRYFEFDRWVPVDTTLTYSLPELGGGEEGGGKPGGKSGGGSTERASASPAPAPIKDGLVYPAPQPVISVPPNATNQIQTILQPEVVNPPELNVPLPLPNVVKVARGPRLPAPPPLVPKVDVKTAPERLPDAPELRAEAQPPSTPYALPLPDAPPLIEDPQLTLPPATPEPPKEVAYVVPKVDPMAAEASVTAAQAPTLALPPGAGGKDDRSVLVLSPIPGPPEAAANIPVGEARGEFAMGPEANLKGSSVEPPGNPLGTEGGAGSGAGGAAAAGAGSASGEGGGGGGGTGKGTGSGTGDGVGPGAGTGSGSGTGTGSGPGIDGTGGGGSGSGTGTGAGSGPGRGEGTGSGTGTGSGSGAGTNPFPGISIAGGSNPSGVVGGRRSRSSKPSGPRPTYGMTIVSTARSGGGLRDYGIFRNESVFTVYIAMTHSPTPAPSWTLQYALLKRPSASSGTITLGGGPVKMQGQVVAPFPVDKEQPEFPEEVLRRNLGRMIVAYAEITTEGKIENSRIIQSPNPLLNQPLIEALGRWTFRPAESNGKPVAVKALLGIPLSLPPH